MNAYHSKIVISLVNIKTTFCSGGIIPDLLALYQRLFYLHRIGCSAALLQHYFCDLS
jgi:hypothetical protein